MRALLCLILLCVLAGPGLAHAGRLVEVRVIDRDTGAILPLYWHAGQAYVAGSPGHRYSVLLENRTGARVLAVLSVDGVNAVSGETAASDQGGYVLAPWGRTEVSGWRKSLSEIAAFEFTALHDSYAARTGRPRNVGVIGVAVFEERRHYLPRHEDEISWSKRQRGHAPGAGAADDARADAPSESARPQSERGLAEHSAAAPSSAAPALADADAAGAKSRSGGFAQHGEPLGTGHGQREWSSARRTQFERASRHAAEIVTIRYDSYANLADAGIVPRPWPRYGHHRDPQPFPGGFAPDPY